jgi:N-acyl-D-aspartate/D-glutamate deacylase
MNDAWLCHWVTQNDATGLGAAPGFIDTHFHAKAEWV